MCRAVQRSGFSLPEILVAIAIIATLAVVAIPAVMNKITDARAAALAQTLDGINEAVQSYRGNVGRYPRLLSQLTTKPTTDVLDICAGTAPEVNRNQWRGPYSSRAFSASGTQVGDGTVSNVLRREPPTGSATYGIAYVDVTGVERDVAFLVERYFDGVSTTPDYLGGSVLWNGGTGPVGMLSFGIPIRGC